MATPAWISLGSNLGDRRAILDAALVALAESPGVGVVAASSYHETRPVGGPPGQGPFLNAAAWLETDRSPRELLADLRAIEDRAGRARTARWGERTLDLDLLIYGTKFLDANDLQLPHPRLALRRFVLGPLAEIAPTIVDTMTGRTIADLLANLDRTPRLVALHGRPGPVKDGVFRGLLEALDAIEIEEEGPHNHPGWGARSGELFAGRVEALRVERWGGAEGRDRWGVATFFLDPRSIESVANLAPETFVEFRSLPEWMGWTAAESRWEGRIRTAREGTVEPTLVVILPGGDRASRKPGVLSVPQLWPESDQPDAIVAEVLATCRGIEAP